jgi:hypothetical protein
MSLLTELEMLEDNPATKIPPERGWQLCAGQSSSKIISRGRAGVFPPVPAAGVRVFHRGGTVSANVTAVWF